MVVMAMVLKVVMAAAVVEKAAEAEIGNLCLFLVEEAEGVSVVDWVVYSAENGCQT
jgi:hypothetical protein